MKRFKGLFAVVVLSIAMVVPAHVYGQGRAGGRASDNSQAAAHPEVAENRYFVAFKDQMKANDVATVRSNGATVHAEFPEVRAIAIEVRNSQQLAAIQNNPRVEYVEPEPMRYPLGLANAQLVPSLNNGLYGLITTKAVDAHNRTKADGTKVTGVGINVGVADTGIDYNHPDIAPAYKGGIDTVSDDGDPSWNNDPAENHGTHVAGTIVAANNTSGVLGVAYSANLFHARVLGPNGGYSSDIMAGVRHLVEIRGCKVVNMSLGGSRGSRTEENFYKEMRNKGALIVAATGNDSATKISYPAAYAVNIAVGAVDRNNVIAGFSNTGRNVDIVGPGVDVQSSVPENTGSEASVTSEQTNYTAFGLEYAGKTSGVQGALVDCGLGTADCTNAVGKIALIQRGDITFADKVTNAMDGGAVGAIIYNNVDGDFIGTLGAATTSDGRAWIPAVSVSKASGQMLINKVGISTSVVNQVSSWDYMSGTSMATPHVTGVVALIWSVNTTATNSVVEDHLYKTATDLGAAGYDTTYGRGIVNADAAVVRAGAQ